jgi:hypothetical protein
MAETNVVLQNDMEAARREARGQYGAHANAEELIRAHAATVSPEVRAASMKPVNEDATKELDRSQIEVPNGGKVVDAVVRGNTISFVWEDESGLWHKGATGYDDSYEAPADSLADQVANEQAKQSVVEREQSIEWQAETAAKIAEVRAELEAEHAQKLADLRQEHESEIEALIAEQQAEAESGGDAPASAPRARRRATKAEASEE